MKIAFRKQYKGKIIVITLNIMAEVFDKKLIEKPGLKTPSKEQSE